jgi:threonylcarbamoyladenosine tRNA methylthiotransferase MtaB
VLASLTTIHDAGYKETVLTGIHLGAYGLDLRPRTTLAELLQRIEEASTSPRIRLSSIEPKEITPELIVVAATSKKICPHFHIPLQSGSDPILTRMNRPYTASFVRTLIDDIMRAMPDAAVGLDIMVGFPGENRQTFEATYALMEELPASYLHVFRYAARPHTLARTMAGQVDPRTKAARVSVLRQLSAHKRVRYYTKYLTRDLELLIEHRREDGMLRGLSPNYIVCLVNGDDALMGREVTVRLSDVHNGRGVGRLVAA